MWNGVVTNLGLSLLEQWAAGSETLYIDKATAGSGTVAQSNMRGSTYVQGEVGDVSIVASIPVTGGTQYRIQVSANPDAAYIMHQIGIWAHLGASGGTTLLALYQDEDGVSVPLAADAPGFGFTLYAVVSMSNQGSVTVNFDGGAYVTRNDMSETLKSYVQTVNSHAPDANGNVTIPIDTTPTQGSQNPVTSGGAYAALADKQDALTFDSAPTSGSTNPVTSGGVYSSEQSIRNTVSIVATGNTAPKAITAGEFVQWQGFLYTAKSNIPSGGTLSTSNLQAVANGGLNALNSRVDTLNSDLTNKNTFNLIDLGTKGTYSDAVLYSALKNDSRILPRRLCAYQGFFAGGLRFGLCLLYEGTKEYGFILVFHYNSAPRYLGVSDATTTLRSWASP